LQYAKFVKPAFDDFVLPTKKYADVILPRGGDNHVAIDLIVQHIRTKLGQHDLRKIYPNVYVIQSTFQVCSYFVYTECSNNVQRQTTCEPKLQTNKAFFGSLCGKMATAGWILCCLICTTIIDCRVLAQLLWLASPYESVFECICRSEECILSFEIRKLQHMILYSTPTVSYAWYVYHINFHAVFRCILCWHCFMCVIRV
jgi:hypothetical protein